MKQTDNPPNEGDLRIWHIPQIPGRPFHIPVGTLDEAVNILAILATYDLFQYAERIKPDYSNAQGLEVFEDGDWLEWADEIEGYDIQQWADNRT